MTRWAVVLTLALGIGANTAIFSVTYAVLLRPLPYSHPESLVLLSAHRKDTGSEAGPLSWPRASAIIDRNRSFAGVAAFTREAFNLTGLGDPEQLPSARVSWNFFDVLGVHPALGRGFLPDEDRPGSANVVLLSHSLWSRRFASDPAILGRHLALDGEDYTIAGVLPVDFSFPQLGPRIEIYAPRVFELNIVTPAQIQNGVSFLECVARLRPGVSMAAAQAELDAISARYRAANPKLPDADPAVSAHAGDLRQESVANIRPTLLILFGAVALVLLIACANVGTLLLSRSLGRRREIAVRMALGAPRWMLFRQLLAESVSLAFAGGAIGVLLSAWGTRALANLAALPRASEIRTDGFVLAFTALASLLTGILAGLAPALEMSKGDINALLRAESRGAAGPSRRHARLRRGLIIAQAALSMVLITGAGLLLRNFIQLRGANPGFDPARVLTMNIALPPARYPGNPQKIAFYDELLKQVRTLAGVRSAAISSALPFNPIRVSPALPEGQPPAPLMQRPFFTIQTFSPGYAAAMRIPLVAGREFSAHDDAAAPPVAIVNATLARRYWPNQNPIGKHILLGRMVKPVEVVGVLGDVANGRIAADVQPEIDLPFAQLPWPSMNVVVRTEGDPRRMAAAVRGRVLAVDRDQPVTGIQTMDEVLETAAAQPRLATTLLATLSALALVLALVGIYSAIACSVAERTSEMGLRMALGAARGDVLAMVIRQGLGLAGAGIALGIAVSLGATRLLASLLYHVSATDPLTFALAAVLFASAAALASYLPARRASRVDPMEALRCE